MNMNELTELIRERDAREMWIAAGCPPTGSIHEWPHVWKIWQGRRGTVRPLICVAAFIDKGPFDRDHPKIVCGGWETNEHVTPGYGRMRKKAEDEPEEMVSLCSKHHLESFAGYNWATANKQLERDYLKKIYPLYYATTMTHVSLSKETR